MTEKQINKRREELRGESYFSQENQELSARSMINSILIYDGVNCARPESWFYQQYLKEYEQKIGKARLEEVIAEQIADFEKADVGWCPNSENLDGGPYKYCNWGDE